MNTRAFPAALKTDLEAGIISLQDVIKEQYRKGMIDVIQDGSGSWQVVASTEAKDRAFRFLTNRSDTDMESRWEFLLSEIMGDFTKPYHYMLGALYKLAANPNDEAVRDEWISCTRHWALDQLQTHVHYMMRLSGKSDIAAAQYEAEQRDIEDDLKRVRG